MNWKPVPLAVYCDHYVVSDAGVVRRITGGKGTRHGAPLKHLPINGYATVQLSWRGRVQRASVHRLVAMAFIGPVPEGKEVNHCDGNRANPNVANLEYVTRQENLLHARRVLKKASGSRCYLAKLNEEQVISLRTRYAQGGITQRTLANEYGLSQSAISAILLKNWKTVENGSDYKTKRSGERHCHAKLTDQQVLEIRALKSVGSTQADLAKRYGIAQSQVSRIITGKRRKAA